VSTDFLALRLFCFNIRQRGTKSSILNYMWTAANFIIEGRRLCTVALNQWFPNWGKLPSGSVPCAENFRAGGQVSSQ